MPLYNWKCEKCHQELEVIRPFADYEIPPNEEEAPVGCDHKWERRIGGKITFIKGAGYWAD